MKYPFLTLAIGALYLVAILGGGLVLLTAAYFKVLWAFVATLAGMIALLAVADFIRWAMDIASCARVLAKKALHDYEQEQTSERQLQPTTAKRQLTKAHKARLQPE